MKKAVLSVLAFSLLATQGVAQQEGPHRCGNHRLLQEIEARQPGFAAQQRQKLAGAQRAVQQRQGAFKTTAQYPIPVVFHIVVSPFQRQAMGGDTGIIRRVNSQLAVLNADYSATNSDLNLVPVPFQPLIGNSGLQFRLASSTSAYTIAPGIEVRNTTAQFDDNTAYAGAKRTASGGLDGWDPTRHLNVWIVNASSGTLGVCIPPQLVGQSFGGHTLTTADLGAVASYGVFGKREFPAQYFYPYGNDRGRTLTHEIGHYFELEHVFGYDNSCGFDDGIADTPPQADATFCSPGCPTFPRYDNCSPAGNGIMFMNFMDYVDDAAMMMFSRGQAERMQLNTAPGGESYSLTQQNPQAVATATQQTEVSLFPNPGEGLFTLENKSAGPLRTLRITDVTGRTVYQNADLPAGAALQLNLTAFGKGLYLLQALSGDAPITQKIILR